VAGASSASARRSAIDIPDKEFFKIGEVARLLGVAPYVLRYWESEFRREVRPERSRGNQRVYRKRDVEQLLRIKRLREDEGLQISGAKRRLRVQAGEEVAPLTRRLAEQLTSCAEELLAIVDADEAAK
jgi:DNA-binding transcriptional MerR regulator